MAKYALVYPRDLAEDPQVMLVGPLPEGTTDAELKLPPWYTVEIVEPEAFEQFAQQEWPGVT